MDFSLVTKRLVLVSVLWTFTRGAILAQEYESLQQWLEKLSDRNDAVRVRAAYHLPNLSLSNRNDFAQLLEGLKHDDPFVRRNVAIALGELDNPPDLIITALISSLQDKNQEVRHFALSSLVRIGARAVPSLVPLLAKSDIEVDPRRAGEHHQTTAVLSDYAVFTLVHIDAPVVPQIVTELERLIKEENGRQATKKEENKTVEGEGAVLSVRETIDRVRIENSWRLTGLPLLLQEAEFIFRQRGARDVKDLLPLLAHQEQSIRSLALQGLLASGHDSPEIMKTLEALADRGDENEAEMAMRKLVLRGRNGVEHLCQIVTEHADSERRAQASRALSQTRDHREQAAVCLIQALLKDSKGEVRGAAASAVSTFFERWELEMPSLGRLSMPTRARDWGRPVVSDEPQPDIPFAQEALAAFVKGLSDPDKTVRSQCARGLSVTMPEYGSKLERFLPNILSAINEHDPATQNDLVLLTSYVKSHSDQSVPVLFAALKNSLSSDATDTARRVIEALGKLAHGNVEVESFLCGLFRDPHGKVLSGEIIDCLGDLAGAPSISILVGELNRNLADNRGNWHRPARALLQSPAGTAALIELLTSSMDANRRMWICSSLADNDSTHDGVTSALREAIHDESPLVRVAAARGLARRKLDAGVAIPILIAALRDSTYGNGQSYLAALDEYDEEGTAALLSVLQSDRGEKGRAEALKALTGVVDKDPLVASVIERLGQLDQHDVALCELIIEELPNMAWTNQQQAVVTEIARALNHPSPHLRNAAATSLAKFPADVVVTALPALLSLVERELSDPDANLATSITKTDRFGLNSSFRPVPVFPALDAIAHCGQLAAPSARKLSKFLEHDQPAVRASVIRILGRLGFDDYTLKNQLARGLNDSDRSVRIAACDALCGLGSLRPEIEARIADMAILDQVNKATTTFLDHIADELRPPIVVYTAASYTMGAGLPSFPWPPPKSAKKTVLPRTLLGTDETSLGAVHDRLKTALQHIDINFESSLFSVPHGFAMLAKLERITEEGKPVAGSLRWRYGDLPPLGLRDYIGRLFFEQSGYFRAFVFVITSEESFGHSNAQLPDLDEGGQILPKELREKPLAGMNCHVLVYAYQRKPGGLVTTFQTLSADAHLQASGVMDALKGR